MPAAFSRERTALDRHLIRRVASAGRIVGTGVALAEADVDRPPRAPPTVHLHRDGDAHRHRGRAHHRADAGRHLPEINIPVVSIIWQFTGLSPNEVEGRMVTISERAMTTTVNSIEHIESQSLAGVGLIRVFFQPDANIGSAVAEVTAINQTLLRTMPPGTTPPLIIRYSASNVPILQLALESPTLSEQQLYDYGLNFIRTQLATVQGAQVPLPWAARRDR